MIIGLLYGKTLLLNTSIFLFDLDQFGPVFDKNKQVV